MKFLSLFSLTFLSIVLSLNSFAIKQVAEHANCAQFLESREAIAALGDKARFTNQFKNPWDESIKAAMAYSRIPAWAKEYIDEAQVVALLNNHEMSLFISHLVTVLEALANDTRVAKSTAARERILLSLFEELPLNAVEKKIGRGELLKNYQFTELNVLGALGFRNLSQMQNLVYGDNLSAPSADSLVGYYIEKSGAKYAMTGFKKGTRRPRGERRLAVAISSSSMTLFKQLFTLPEFFYHVHNPRQGTLIISHMGQTGTYANLNEQLRFPSEGSLLPMVLLQSSEANRMRNFLQLSKIQNRQRNGMPLLDENGMSINMPSGQDCAKHPWNLNGYCARGGYTCCTHWIGNIPIGDNLVDAYTFPGNVDSYAHNASSSRAQRQKLREYNYNNPLMHLVWKVPGNEQLADVLGVRSANLRGELANPGWVLHTLAGAVSSERVPVVFYAVQDHREEFTAPIDMQTDPH